MKQTNGEYIVMILENIYKTVLAVYCSDEYSQSPSRNDILIVTTQTSAEEVGSGTWYFVSTTCFN